jgi:Tfp pilus assembly PilM family ATPase
MQKAIDLLIQQLQRQGFSVVLLCIAVYALWTLMQLQQQEHRIQMAEMNVRIDELTIELTACNAARLRQEGELNLLRKQIDQLCR